MNRPRQTHWLNQIKNREKEGGADLLCTSGDSGGDDDDEADLGEED